MQLPDSFERSNPTSSFCRFGRTLLLPAALVACSIAVGRAEAQEPPAPPACTPAAGQLSFCGIPPAQTVTESHAWFEERKARVLEWAAQRNIDGVTPRDRDTTLALTTWVIARILLDLPTDAAVPAFLQARGPFAPVGSSGDFVPGCERKGDYDFALMNLLSMMYVAREHPGRFSEDAQRAILERLLTTRGRIDNVRVQLNCFGLKLDAVDTENHILMTQFARYLTNQLLIKLPQYANDPQYDNARNGNNRWVVEHLSSFLKKGGFHEYNSRPYQDYTVQAIELIHSFAEDPDVVLASGMVLDFITGMTAVQSSELRRFPPFRRRPEYLNSSALQSNGEAARLGLLIGNHGFIESTGYELPNGFKALWAAAAKYEVDDVLRDLAIREDGRPRYVVANHSVAELYASSPSVLISAGGHVTPGVVSDFRVAGISAGRLVKRLIEQLGQAALQQDRGLAQPTVLIPTGEPSNDWLDMPRFEGHEDSDRRENLCVAPGFACGMTPRLGRVIEPVAAACSVTEGGFRFFNFTGGSCPLDYGFYMALYERPCDSDQCRQMSATDRYGLLEVGEADASSFDEFRASVLRQNPGPFSSVGVHNYVTTTGRRISFEINPPSGRSPIIAVDELTFDRDYRTWPLARGESVQSTTPGRITFDSAGVAGRLILDVTQARPRRIRTFLPALRRESSVGGDGGGVFDDGGAVTPNDGLARIAVRSGARVDAIQTSWRNGLAASHGGGGGSRQELVLEADEFISEVGIGTQRLSADRDRRLGVDYLRIRTSKGRQLIAGQGQEEHAYAAGPGEQIIAFHGRAGEEIDRLGVVIGKIQEVGPLANAALFVSDEGDVDGGTPPADGADGTKSVSADVDERSAEPRAAANCAVHIGVPASSAFASWLLLLGAAWRLAGSQKRKR